MVDVHLMVLVSSAHCPHSVNLFLLSSSSSVMPPTVHLHEPTLNNHPADADGAAHEITFHPQDFQRN